MKTGLSKPTLIYAGYIVISASFMRQLRTLMNNLFSEPVVINFFRVFFFAVFLFVLAYALRMRLRLFWLGVIVCIFVLACLFSLRQPYFTEQTHVLTYGLLGFLAAGDISGQKRLLLKGFILTETFVAIISAADEIFQYLLPYRVGELRDFLTNIVSALFGIGLFVALKTKLKPCD